MRISTLGVFGAALTLLPAAANAQWMPGSELAGQSVQVETNGTVNTIHFDPGGAARIITPRGTVIPGSWTSGPSGLCLNANGAQECWSYAAPMAAGQAVAMTSSCGAVSTWNPAGTNAPPPPPQQPSAEGERG
jgi:hypothetical protein